MEFSPGDVPVLLKEGFAPWVQALQLAYVSHDETSCRFRMPANEELSRQGGPGGGVVCGQALASAADTVAVAGIAVLSGRMRPCTSTDIAIRFMRPVPPGDVEIEVTPLSNGKRMAVVEVRMRPAGASKVAAHATLTLVWLD